MASVPAYEKHVLPSTFSLNANADLSSYQYYPVKFTSGKATIATVLGEDCIGIQQNAPAAADRACEIAWEGISRCVVGTGGATQGSYAVATTDGLTDQTSPDQFVLGRFLSDGSATEIISVQLTMTGSAGSQAAADGGVIYKAVTISTAQVLAANTTPVELVAAPGAGKCLEFLSAAMFIDYNSATYATNGDITIQTGTTGTAQSDTVAAADFLFKTADFYRMVQVLSADTQLDANESLVWAVGTGDPVTGDSPVYVHVAYRVHDFS